MIKLIRVLSWHLCICRPTPSVVIIRLYSCRCVRECVWARCKNSYNDCCFCCCNCYRFCHCSWYCCWCWSTFVTASVYIIVVATRVYIIVVVPASGVGLSLRLLLGLILSAENVRNSPSKLFLGIRCNVRVVWRPLPTTSHLQVRRVGVGMCSVGW